MKWKILGSLLIVLTVLTSCSTVNNKNMMVTKDCTGYYLRYNEKDYHVCNDELLNKYKDGTKVKASFNKVEKCQLSGGISCRMLHINEGPVKVTKIK